MAKQAQYQFKMQMKVAWGDMDAFGHVNNVSYARYLKPLALSISQAFNCGLLVSTSRRPVRCSFTWILTIENKLRIRRH
jgi:hypothetical protein